MMGNHRSALDEVIAYQNMCKAHQVGFLPRSASHNIVDQTRDKTLTSCLPLNRLLFSHM